MAEQTNTPKGNYERFLEILGQEQLDNPELMGQIRLFCDAFPGNMSDPYWLLAVVNGGMVTMDGGRQISPTTGLWERLQSDYTTRGNTAILPDSDLGRACGRIFAVISARIADPTFSQRPEVRNYYTAGEVAAQAKIETTELEKQLAEMAERVRELVNQQVNDPRNDRIHHLEEQLRRSEQALTHMQEENRRKDQQINQLIKEVARLRNQPGSGPAQAQAAPGPERKIPDYDYLTIFGIDKEWFYKNVSGKSAHRDPRAPAQMELKTDDEIKKELFKMRAEILRFCHEDRVGTIRKVDPAGAEYLERLGRTANAAYDTLSRPDTRKIYLGLHNITLD